MTAAAGRFVTKTGYVGGLGCRKEWWLLCNAPGRLPPPDASGRFRRAQGQEVGAWARQRYPHGLLVPPADPERNDRASREMLSRRVPLFEAGFLHPDGTCYARADILVPVGREEWDLVEVKSRTGPEEEDVHDVAFQRYCFVAAGVRLRRCRLLHLDGGYVRSGEIDPGRLFAEADITAEVEQALPHVGPNVAELLRVAALAEPPEFGRGEGFHPDEAGVHDDDEIWRTHPDADISELYRGGRRKVELLERGIFRMEEIPDGTTLTAPQQIQRAAHACGRPHVDRRALVAFLSGLRYPLHFLDFETFSTAVPLLDGTRPYQQVPFQFSVHVVQTPGAAPVPRSFLSLEPVDPRPELVAALRTAVGRSGHVIAYNQAFERRVLGDLAERFPEHTDWLTELSGRFVDLYAPFRSLAYYHPSQQGSASLKAVLPAVTGIDYTGLEIADGGAATLAYLGAAFGIPGPGDASPARVAATREALLRYCGQDTAGMVRIVERLAEIVHPAADS